MTDAALLSQYDLENQAGGGSIFSKSAATSNVQRIYPVLWAKQFIADTSLESLFLDVGITYREVFASALSALPFGRLGGSRYSAVGHVEELVSENMAHVIPSSRDEISPDAEEYARHLGIFGSLLRAQEIVWCVVPQSRCLRIDRYDDPEEEGQSLIRMTIMTSERADRVVQLDDQLEDIFCTEIPSRHQPYFAFTYQFEK